MRTRTCGQRPLRVCYPCQNTEITFFFIDTNIYLGEGERLDSSIQFKQEANNDNREATCVSTSLH